MPLAPDVDRVLEFFTREDGVIRAESPKSTLLFPYFAQWFTDGFLRSDRSEPRDPRRNESNHEIDLMQLYGLNPSQTRALRTFRAAGSRARRSTARSIPRTCASREGQAGVRRPAGGPLREPGDAQKDRLFAMGSDTVELSSSASCS